MSADILSFIIFLPAGIAFALMITTRHVETVRNIAFLTTLVILALVLKIYIGFEPSKAIPHYKEILRTNEEDITSLNNLAYLLHQEGTLDTADEYAERAVKLAPENPNILDTAGSIKIALGEKKQAMTLLEKATALAPANLEFKKHLDMAKSL